MDESLRTTPSDSTQSSLLIPAKKRLITFLIAFLGIVFVNHAAFQPANHTHSTATICGLSILLVLELFCVSLLCGYGKDPAWFKWAALIWIFTLINLHMASFGGVYAEPRQLPIIAMFAGQAGMVLTWLVMGTVNFARRLIGALALLSGLALASAQQIKYQWFSLFFAFVISLLLILVFLRFAGYRLRTSDPDDDGLRSMQFGLRQVLLLTTTMAIAMAVIRSQQDWLLFSLSDQVNSVSLPILMLGLASAIVAVVSCWCALGDGRLITRSLVFLLIVTALGCGVSYWFVSLSSTMNTNRIRMNYRLWRLAQAEWMWLAWFALSGIMLVASLTFFRVRGLRFTRNR